MPSMKNVNVNGAPSATYYSAGSTELATETPLTVKKLEPRRRLTKNSNRLVIVLVGLPARGKSFVARKLQYYVEWHGVKCRIFNVGRYRREAYAEMIDEKDDLEHASASVGSNTRGACAADFFDSNNKEAARLREKVAEVALRDMLKWLDEDESDTMSEEDVSYQDRSSSSNDLTKSNLSRHGSFGNFSTISSRLRVEQNERIAIYDATNSTDQRRQWILEECTSPEKRPGKPTGVVFVESVCDDQELLEENLRFKATNSPDYEGMDLEEALADLRVRVQKYEAQYETIMDDSLSYIKMFNLSTKMLVNHVYGRMAKDLVPALMAWHIGTRPVYLCRPGETISAIQTDSEDYVNRNKIDPTHPRFMHMSYQTKKKSMRGDTLGHMGLKFREELLDFLYDEVHNFMFKRASVHDMAYTGTSISGLAPVAGLRNGPASYKENPAGSDEVDPFPLRILTSTMPRAVDTVQWNEYEFSVNDMSNLNPLDKGDFAGMELSECRKLNPCWYEKLERDPYGTRFPGGECYRDLIRRLTPILIDVEQQVIPTLVVSHLSILQCLMAYFRNTPVEKCMSIEVPMHTVIKYTPVRGGGWSESQHPLFENDGNNSTPPSPACYGGKTTNVISSVESESEFSALSADDNNNSHVPYTSPIWSDPIVSFPLGPGSASPNGSS